MPNQKNQLWTSVFSSISQKSHDQLTNLWVQLANCSNISDQPQQKTLNPMLSCILTQIMGDGETCPQNLGQARKKDKNWIVVLMPGIIYLFYLFLFLLKSIYKSYNNIDKIKSSYSRT